MYNSRESLEGRFGPQAALDSGMRTTRKLALERHTIAKLTPADLQVIEGGVSGAAINPTGGDTRGPWLSAKWYAQKWTIVK
jgi:hypothetical protein